jgi:glycosyltransferase involved in cell wall biosynthesis
VPSKILSYLCAGKPIVLAAPRDNLAAEIIRQSGAGIVVDCEDMEGFRSAVKTLMDDSDLREKAGILARKYAEENFDIDRVTDRFETIVLS